MITQSFRLRKDIYPDGVVSNNIRVIVPNGGGDLADDWLNATSGLAADWNVANSGTGTDITDIVTSIVTGSGFSGNAQEMLINKTSSGFAEYTLASDDIYDNYEVGEWIRISFYYRANTAFRLYMKTSLVADIALNTGNAILYTIDYQIPFADAKYPNFRIRKNPVIANDYIQIDTVNIKRLPVIAEYTFEGDVLDDSGNSNDLTNNGATLTTGRHGVANNAYLFNGTTAYMELPTATYELQLADVKVVRSRFKSTITSVGSFMSVGVTGNSNLYSWCDCRLNADGTLRLSYTANNGGVLNGVSTVNTFNDGNWHDVIFVFSLNRVYNDITGFDIYVDGIIQTLTNATTVNTALSTIQGKSVIGRYSAQTISYFNGTFDLLKIVNRELTIAERKAEFRKYPK